MRVSACFGGEGARSDGLGFASHVTILQICNVHCCLSESLSQITDPGNISASYIIHLPVLLMSSTVSYDP